MKRWRKTFRQGWQTTHELRAGTVIAHSIQTHYIPPTSSRLGGYYRHELRIASPSFKANVGIGQVGARALFNADEVDG